MNVRMQRTRGILSRHLLHIVVVIVILVVVVLALHLDVLDLDAAWSGGGHILRFDLQPCMYERAE